MSTKTVDELFKSIERLNEAQVGNAKYYETVVSPHNAAVMLERKRPHHIVNQSAVHRYADAMKEGSWVLNGMPIIFGTDGTLLDGVQRLTACVQSDTPFKTVIAENIREDTLHTIDQHRRRSYNGVLESRREAHAGALMRTMSKLIRIENGKVGMPDTQISWMRYDTVLDKNPELRQAVNLSTQQRRVPLRSTARHVLAFMAISAGHQKEISVFFDALRQPENYAANHPAVVLGTQLRIADEQGTPFGVDASLAMAIMAFNDMLDGKHRRTYKWQPDYGKADLDRDGNPINRKQLKEKAPANLGLPLVKGYKGLPGGKQQETDHSENSPLIELLREGAEGSAEEHEGDHKIIPLTVEPDVAQQWLNNHNKGNRRILQGHAEAIARDIVEGRWEFNAQPICFSKTGRLLNGQHRLQACVEAGQPIDILVMTGLPDEAFATYDIHARRTAALELSKGKDAPVDLRVVAAAAKIVWVKDRMDAGLPVSARPSASEIKVTVEENPGLIDAYPRGRKLSGIASAGVMTYVVWYTREKRPELADEFLDALETGAGLTKENPLLKVRNQLLIERHAPGGYRSKKFLNEILSCWDDYVAFKDDPVNWKKNRRKRNSETSSTIQDGQENLL